MTYRTPYWPALLLLLLLTQPLLSACTSAPRHQPPQRQALYGLGERVAQAVVNEPQWPEKSQEAVLLLTPPKIAPALGIDNDHFRETLIRALLAHESGPQVLAWQAEADIAGATELPSGQWLLQSQLQTEGPRLTLSDRDLLPYRLKLILRRPGGVAASHWEKVIHGALDADAL